MDDGLAPGGSQQRVSIKITLPKKNRLIDCIDTPLEQQVLDVAQRERVADLHHYRQSDDLRACLEVL